VFEFSKIYIIIRNESSLLFLTSLTKIWKSKFPDIIIKIHL